MILIAPLLSLSEPVTASIWQDLWQNPDQQGLEALDAGDAAAAQSLFEDSQWRGSAAYRAEDYASAIGEFIGQDSPDAHYNRGNALAKSGDLEGAIDAYNRALELQPEMEDALANRDLVEKLQQQQEQNKEQEQDQDQQSDQQQQNQDQNQESSQQQNQESQQSQNKEQGEEGSEQQQEAKTQKEQQEEEEQQTERQQQQKEQEQEQEAQPADPELSDQEKQNQQEIEQMLRQVPDDPGGLLREKFRYQSRQRALEQRRPKPPNEQERW